MRIAEVFVNIPVKSIAKAYSYLIPSDMDFLSAGWRVLVPFGGRRVEGFIVNVADSLVLEVAPVLSAVLFLITVPPAVEPARFTDLVLPDNFFDEEPDWLPLESLFFSSSFSFLMALSSLL